MKILQLLSKASFKNNSILETITHINKKTIKIYVYIVIYETKKDFITFDRRKKKEDLASKDEKF